MTNKCYSDWQVQEKDKNKTINETASGTRGPLAKSTTASGAMMGNVELHCPLSQHAQIHQQCGRCFSFPFFLSFIFLPKRGQISELTAPAKPAADSWMYLAVFLLGRRFNEKPSPAVTPHLGLKRAVLACLNRPTPPSMFCALKVLANYYFLIVIFNSVPSPAAN